VEPQWVPVDVVPIEGVTASMQMCEPAILLDAVTPVEVRDLGNGSWRIDFGQIVNALFAIELPSLPAGHLTRATFSDVDAEEYDWEICGYDEYVSSGRPEGDSFRNRFNHHVFRYVQLDSLPEAPVSVSAFPIRAAFSGTTGTWWTARASSDWVTAGTGMRRPRPCLPSPTRLRCC